METSFYQQLTARRKSWEIIEPDTIQNNKEGTNRTLSKALSLAELELPVGQFITDELNKSRKQLTQPIINLLRLNIEDETKHDTVLRNLAKVHKPYQQDNLIDQPVVEDMVTQAKELADLYSPITVAGVLESSVFFVLLPMMRFFGDVSFRTVANDISNDEAVHTATNIQLAKDLGWHRGNRLNKFRKDVVSWLVADLPYQNSEAPRLSQDFWLKSSDSLYDNGKAATLAQTKRAVMPSFFETSNTSLPIYG